MGGGISAEVAKKALHHNAAAVIFAHNHPSGISEPSQADRHITDKLKQALALFDIRVLDHFIIGDGPPYSLRSMDCFKEVYQTKYCLKPSSPARRYNRIF